MMMKIPDKKDFLIRIHVSERRRQEGMQILNSMICNLEDFESGKDRLRWKFGDSIRDNVELVIDKSMLND